MYVERLIKDRLVTLFENFSVVVISGARQVGKSTLLEHAFNPRIPAVVFDPVIDVENARQDPELFLNHHHCPVILDEIQYAPELVPVIKRRVDQNKKPGQYLITGSQQWGVLKTIAESLAGRAVFLDIEGFCLGEIAQQTFNKSWLQAWLENPDQFLDQSSNRLPLPKSVYEQIWCGFFPEAQFLKPDLIPDFYRAYQRTYLERDVRVMGEITDLQTFGNFFRLAAALTAQEINFSQLGREIGMSPQTAWRWLDLLKATYQWFEIPTYSGNTVKRVSGKSKGYLSDSGLACWALAISSPEALAGHPAWGALFETAVVGEIRKLSSLLPVPPRLYHWRSHGGAEVDLILERNGRFYPIEIKAASRPSTSDVSGITAFRKTYPQLQTQRGLILAPVEKITPLSKHDVAIPWDFFNHSQARLSRC